MKQHEAGPSDGVQKSPPWRSLAEDLPAGEDLRRAARSVCRVFRGPAATEVFILSCPQGLDSDDLAGQTEAVYRQLPSQLSSYGVEPEHVVKETVLFRDIQGDLEPFLEVRAGTLIQEGEEGVYRPASTFVEQPPLDPQARLVVLASAVVPKSGTVPYQMTRVDPVCACELCGPTRARIITVGGERHISAGNIMGKPGAAFDEASSMFRVAEKLLRGAGTDFHSVVRTWIYLRHMDRDYAEFNRARRAFFERLGISLRPASTGIHGAPCSPEHNFCLGFDAIAAPGGPEVALMTTPTLNEAWEYGSDFSRGLRVEDANKTSLYVSGTASINEAGETVHVGQLGRQVERMLLNISQLLEHQGSSFDDVVSGMTYLKRAEDAPRLREILRQRGIDGFPNALVEAHVCRPDLLCEMEVLALRSRSKR